MRNMIHLAMASASLGPRSSKRGLKRKRERDEESLNLRKKKKNVKGRGLNERTYAKKKNPMDVRITAIRVGK